MSDVFDLLAAQRRIFGSSLRPLERLVALALTDHWSRSSNNPFPGVNRLAERTGLDRKAVMRALRGLAEAGAIKVTSRAGQSNSYDLSPLMTLEPVPQRDRSSRGTSPPEGPQPVPQRDRNRSPRGTLRNQEKEPKKEPRVARAPKRGAQAPLFGDQTPEQTSAHAQVTACYFDEFRRKHEGRDPVFGGAEGTAVKRLLERLKGDAAEACRRIAIAFAGYRGATVTIRDIASKPDAFASAEVHRVSKVVPIQRGTMPGVDPAQWGRAAAKEFDR